MGDYAEKQMRKLDEIAVLDARQTEALKEMITQTHTAVQAQILEIQTQTQQLSERIEMLTLYSKVSALERSRRLYFRSWEQDEIIEKWKTRGQCAAAADFDDFDLNFLFIEQ